ncbi:MAG: DUF1697 domain-containing protein [Acidobacteria bacterium]|nr:DUF1697 domain-containing protein [Acidobacteriota bacterium]
MGRYAALLRGVNVGGRAKVAMAPLRATFADLGCTEVATYVQSGNVVFTAPGTAAALERAIEQRLAAELALDIRVAVRSAADLRRVVAGNPFLPGADPQALHVMFLIDPPPAARLRALPTGGSGEAVQAGRHELYLHLPGGMGRAKLPAAVGRAIGVPTTVRNWRTVTALAELAGSGR